MGKKVKEVVWSELAISTLQIIYDFIAKDSIREAERQVDRILDRTELLAKGWIKTAQRGVQFKGNKD